MSSPIFQGRHSERSEESLHFARSTENRRTTEPAAPSVLSRLRARLQPCRTTPQSVGALAPEVRPRFRPITRLLQTILVAALAIVMLGAKDTSAKRYERVGHNMMCACGCGQILLECNHVGCPDSARMIGELKDQLATDNSDRVVLDWFVQKYGATILAAPLRGGFDNVAWITPIALFLAAILGTALIIRIWKSRTAQRAPLRIKGMSASSTDELRDRIRRETHY